VFDRQYADLSSIVKSSPTLGHKLRWPGIPILRLVTTMLILIMVVQSGSLASAWLLNISRIRFLNALLKPNATTEFRSVQLAETERLLRGMQEHNTSNSRFHFVLGQLSQHLHKTDMAVDSFQHATALDKRDVVSWWYLADLYYGRGDVALAIQAWRKAGVARDKAVKFWWQGVYQERAKKFEEAQTAYRVAMDLLPDYTDAYYGYISACWGQSRQGQPDCLEIANRLMTLDKTDSSRRAFEEGRLALLNGQTERAVAAFQKSLSIDPSFCLAKRFLVVSLQQVGRSSEATEAMNRKIPGCGE